MVYAQPGGGSGTPSGSGGTPQYDPHADTRFYCGHLAVEHVSTEAFGWYDMSASVDLRITEPIVAGDESATGVNSIAQSFSIHFTSLVAIDPDNQASRRLAWAWSGLFEGPFGDYPCYGLMVQDEDTLWCLPTVVFRNEATANDLYEFLSDMQSRALCALDEIAMFTRDQNLIEYEACSNEGETFCEVALIGVGVPALVACYAGGPPGCLAGGAAILGIGIMHELWKYNMKNEWERSMQQLCLESQWRRDHPSGPPPPSSQGEFECQEPVSFPW